MVWEMELLVIYKRIVYDESVIFIFCVVYMNIVNRLFAMIVSLLAHVAIPAVEWGKRVTGWQTYRFEEGFVLCALVAVNITTGSLLNP